MSADLLAARVAPEKAGFDRARLQRVDSHLRGRYVDPEKIAGCVTAVWRGGHLAHLSCLGEMDRERSRPMREDTIFRIYSMTKPITSVALLMLYERGLVQLTDPVHKYIPAFRDLAVYRSGTYPDYVTEPAARAMTVHDLLTHMSGLTYGFMELTPVDEAYRTLGIGGPPLGGSLAAMVEQLAQLPLEFSPGSGWNYSVATDVVAHLVELLYGRPFDQYLREEILDPLGMDDTAFTVAAESVDRFAANYERDESKRLRLVDDPLTSHFTRNVTLLSGGGGLVSTAADYLRFCRMLLAGGALDGVRILGKKTVELMTMNHLPGGRDLSTLARGSFSETTYDGVGFGLGVSVTIDLVRARSVGSLGEYGWGGMASTVFWIDPREELIVLFLTQLMPSGTFNFRGQLKQLVYAALTE